MEYQQVIDNKLYDTSAAEMICDVSPSGFSTSDFNYEDTRLFRTAKGAFFVAGEGGPMTRWATNVANGRQGGRGIQVVTQDEARQLVERHGSPQMYEKAFGKPETA